MDTDFIIVGGGIGGAVVGGLLASGGKKVIVLEKSTAPPNWVRPEVLWPATAQVLFSLLPRENLERDAMLPLRGVRATRRGQAVISIDSELLNQIQVQPWTTNPNRTREQLLAGGLFELRRGMEVVAVLKQNERIIGVKARDGRDGSVRDVTAQFTIGDDGVHSLVRAACGIEIDTKVFPLDFLCFEFQWPGSLPAAVGRVWLNPDSASGFVAMLALPLPQNKGAGLVAASPDVFEGKRKVSAPEGWERFRSSEPEITEVLCGRDFRTDLVRVRRPWGHARRYGAQGAFIMGDAAHPVSPAGGQGANMSVADACALADIFLQGSEDPLAAYERRRRPANERSLLFTRRADQILGLPNWLLPASLLLRGARWAGCHPSLLRRFVKFASTAFLESPV
jgi:2-polyprenyl-6-methoxyphenol hydroxylase-like FAD-dependent oxidoreductase